MLYPSRNLARVIFPSNRAIEYHCNLLSSYYCSVERRGFRARVLPLRVPETLRFVVPVKAFCFVILVLLNSG